MKIAVLGLGEAGARFARDLLELGEQVAGWDPAPGRSLPGVSAASDGEAAEGAGLVLGISSASVAVASATSVAPHLGAGAVFADCNTGSPGLKRAVAGALEGSGALFADVALMAPVGRAGLRTPCLVSGPGAARFAEMMTAYGTPVEVVDERPGSAAARKLLRSVFMKGLAAAVVEALASAEHLGLRDWLADDIAGELERADRGLLDRLVEGSRRHARRRIEEMEAAAALERELDVVPRVAEAAVGVLAELSALELERD